MGREWPLSETTGREHELDMIGRYNAGELILKRKTASKAFLSDVEKLKNDPRNITRKGNLKFHLMQQLIDSHYPAEVMVKKWDKVKKKEIRKKKDLRINPERLVFRDIYNHVAEKLFGEDGAEDIELLKEKLHFINTIDTPLDYMGVDGMFVYVDDKGRKRYVEIDVTKNVRDKPSAADLPEVRQGTVLMVGEPPDRKKNREEYIKWFTDYADEIVSKLQY